MDKIDDGFGDEVFNTPLQPYTPVGTPGPSASSGGSRFDKASPYGRFDKDKPSKEMQDKMKTNEMDWQMQQKMPMDPYAPRVHESRRGFKMQDQGKQQKMMLLNEIDGMGLGI